MNNRGDGSPIWDPLKKYDSILNNKNESFTKKSESLVEVWQNLAQCRFENSDLTNIVQIIDWAKLHTLNIVLTGEWKKFKDQYQENLLKEVKATQNQVTKINNAFYTRCQKLLDVINNPWSDPTLEYLVRTPNATIGTKEIDFFCGETVYLTSVRLKKLCESQCEDLALNLVKAFMKCYRMSQIGNFNLNATETQVWFIFDIYVALLYKFKENDSLLEMLKGLSAEEGWNLIKRFSKKRVTISKVWKHCHRIAIIASQVYISSTILKPIEEVQDILKELIRAYVSLNSSEEFLKDVVDSVRSIIRLAETAAHIYIFCDAFQEKFETKMKAFIIELYIRALTTDMNLVERQKSDNDKEKMVETLNRLAGGFTKLADVLKGDVCVSRECILTAFSLQPTSERMKKIEELAKLSGFEVLDTGQEWKCKLHPPVLPSDDIAWMCNACGEYMCKPQLNVPLNTNTALNEALTEEKLGITRELCDDLVVLLSSPRYQVFSWLLNWQDLHRLCVMYLNDPERTKNVVTELKFLDIDYSIFAGIKKEPLDEFAGIERGYEHYLDHEFMSDVDRMSDTSEDTASQESRFYMSSDSASEIHQLPVVGHKKSDPNTLKSLRMFRPSLKRPKVNPETLIPEKVLKCHPMDLSVPSTSKKQESSFSNFLQSPPSWVRTQNNEPSTYSRQDVEASNTASRFNFTGLLTRPEPLDKDNRQEKQPPPESFTRNMPPKEELPQMKIGCLRAINSKLFAINKPVEGFSLADIDVDHLCASFINEIRQQYGMNSSCYRSSSAPNNHSSSAPNNDSSSAPNNHSSTAPNNHSSSAPNNHSSSAPNHHSSSVPNNHSRGAPASANQNPKSNHVIENVNTPYSKNGQVATLQQVGGRQVAVEKNSISPLAGSGPTPNLLEKTYQISKVAQVQESATGNKRCAFFPETTNTETTMKNATVSDTVCNSSSNQTAPTQYIKIRDFSKEILELEQKIWNCSSAESTTVSSYQPPVVLPKHEENTHEQNYFQGAEGPCDQQFQQNDFQKAKEPCDQHSLQQYFQKAEKLCDQQFQQNDFQKAEESCDQQSLPENFQKAEESCDQQSQQNYFQEAEKPCDHQFQQNDFQIAEEPCNQQKEFQNAKEPAEESCDQQSQQNDFQKAEAPCDQQSQQNDFPRAKEPCDQQKDFQNVKEPCDQQSQQNDFQRAEEPCDQQSQQIDFQREFCDQLKNFQKAREPCDQIIQQHNFPNAEKPYDQQSQQNDFEKSRAPCDQQSQQNDFLKAKEPCDQQLTQKVSQKAREPRDQQFQQKYLQKAEAPCDQQSQQNDFLKAIEPCDQQLTQNVFQKAREPCDQQFQQKDFQKAEAPCDKQFQQKSFQNAKEPCDQQFKQNDFLNAKAPCYQQSKQHDSQKAEKPCEQQSQQNDFQKAEAACDQQSQQKDLQKAKAPCDQESQRKNLQKAEDPCDQKSQQNNFLKAGDSSDQQSHNEIELENPSKLENFEELLELRTKFDPKTSRCYSRKSKTKRNISRDVREEIKTSLTGEDLSMLSTNDNIESYADTLISSDSEYECFASSNPLLENVKKHLELFEKRMASSRKIRKGLRVKEKQSVKNQPGPSTIKNKTKTLVLKKEFYKTKRKSVSKREPKYESYPDTGSDSQLDVDSDDPYPKCYIELYRNNLLYDATKGVCRNIDYYLKRKVKINAKNQPAKQGKKLKKNKKSKTAITSNKTALDVGSKNIPKSNIPIRDIRVILNRLPASYCRIYERESIEKSKEHVGSLKKDLAEVDNNFNNLESDKENSVSSNDSYVTSQDNECQIKSCEDDSRSSDSSTTPLAELIRKKMSKENQSSGSDIDDHNVLKREKKGEKKDYTRFPTKKYELVKQVLEEEPPIKLPKKMLERMCLADKNYVRSVLANVPGLHDTELIRPTNTDMVVNVVQISGGRNATNVPVANTQTSTQVTPHIQRIGQPRIEKAQNDQADNVEPSMTSATTSVVNNVKPANSQPSTLINILSQQVIRPGQSNCVRRPSPLINIVSHQIIRPSFSPMAKMTTSSVQTSGQVNQATKPETSSAPPTLTNVSAIKNVAATVKSATGHSAAPAPGTILQFICKSASLPKFQQAFGKTVYQTNSVEATEATSTEENANMPTESSKKTTTKTPTVNLQPVQGSVIYTRQVPVGQTINLIPPGRQVFRIATSNNDQISLVKDTVIHSKMSALLTAALQGKKATEVQVESEGSGDSTEKVNVGRPTLVQNARIVKPVIQIPSNVIRTSTQAQSNLSSTTLEQLREFDMVYKQIKERSNTGTTPPESSSQSETENSPQGISVTYLNQGQKFTQLSPVVVVSSYCNLQPAASPALSVTSQGSSSPCVTPAPTPTLPKVSSKTSSKGKSLKTTPTHTSSKASPIPKPQQKPQEDEHTTQRIFDILAEYAEQLRNSPDLNNKPAPRRRSNPPTNPNHNSKRKKSSSSKKPSTGGSAISESDLEDQRTIGSEDSSCGVVQLSVKDEEQSQTQTTESNDSTTSTRPMIFSETNSNSTTRNVIIADSSVGEALKLQNTAVLMPGNYIMPVSMVKGGQQIAVVSGGSKILATVPARSGPNMLLLQSFLNQNRKSNVQTVKYSTIQSVTGFTQNLQGVGSQSQLILPQSVPNLTGLTLGQPLTLKKIEEFEKRLNTELLLAIAQPRDSTNVTENNPQPDSSTGARNSNSIKTDDSPALSSSSSEKVFTYHKSTTTTPIATPVISQTSNIKNGTEEGTTMTQPSIITLNIPSENKDDSSKTNKRVQSVLVTACSSNGPMLSHTPPRYRKPAESTPATNEANMKTNYLNNGEKVQKDGAKHFQTTVYFHNKNKKVVTNPGRLDRELHQLCLQRKQAAMERELRLQKSLSEECEDLGVDEPSTSDLFPEADLLFDSNHSPSFDQTSQDIGKKILHHDVKDKSITLFSDDDNSSSLRNEFLFDSVQYQTEGDIQYERTRQLTNGQGSTSNESGSSCEDSTLLQNCASMSDVTLNSPISPEFTDNPTHMNKYKFKYSNKKKTERHKQVETWSTGGEVSSSEDTMCSEISKIAHSSKRCVIRIDDDEVVRVAISKTDLAKDEESCEELHYEDDLDSPSGRGARRSVKKMCSCCNGAKEGNRKRPSSSPHMPALPKKAFLNKKR